MNNVFGVVVGGTVAFVVAVVGSLPFALFLTPDSQHPDALAPTHMNMALYFVQVVVVLLCIVFGGYIGAAVANRRERLNGTLSCFSFVCAGVFEILSKSGADPRWLVVLILIASPALGFIGGDFRLRKRLAH